MRATITRSSPVVRTARTVQVSGIFDLPPTENSTLTWDVNLPLDEEPWNVGLIVGPSGTGKTTIAREFWPEALDARFDWPPDRAVVDGFPDEMGTKEVVALLSSVGFSSPPAWLRPFHVLSNGEQFRAGIARLLAENREVTVVDEFTSVVDRTVAKIASAAVAKAVRRADRRFVAVSCHYDVEDWLQPDWVYQPHVDAFTWRSVLPRPRIALDVERVHHSAWRLFGPHHYLSATLNKSAACFVGTWDDHPTVFCGVLPFPHPKYRRAYRISRLVTLPDFQGVGLGNAFADYIAGVYRAAGRDLFLTTGHPAQIHSLARSPHWAMGRQPSFTSGKGDTGFGGGMTRASERLTAGFRYAGPPAEGSPLLACL